MRTIISPLCILLVCTISMNAQLWTSIDESIIRLQPNEQRTIIPDAYHTLRLDLKRINKILSKAPTEQVHKKSQSSVTVEIPMPDGTIEAFAIYQSTVMRPGLQAKYPNIRSYKGYAHEHPGTHIRLVLSSLGFHGSIKTPKGQVYIDPYSDHTTEHYISYYTRDHHLKTNKDRLACGHDIVNDIDNQVWENTLESEAHGISLRSPSEAVVLREYDFALACTGEWGATQTDLESIMAKFNIGVSRLNQIFENELAFRIILIENNDLLIQTDAMTDPYTSRQGFDILGENTNAINNIVGSDAYDFGHIWSNCNDTGGVAFGSSACTGDKGAGVTCIGSNADVSSVVVNIMAHEIGHQLSAGHSWNKCTDDLTGQYAPASAFEPGSGVTIMSYAGLCGGNNVSGTNTDVYHVGSLDQMRFYTTENVADACASKTTTENHTPESIIPIEGGFYIPISTPFELTGDAIDPDGDAMTYTWEQYDLGPSVDLGNPAGTSPLFRNYYPSTNKTRVFPNINDLIVGASNKNEVLPTISRDLSFRFVVRDNNPIIGGVDWELIKFKSTSSAGPFEVLFPTIDEAFVVGDTMTVLWDVANTDMSPINCEKVNIMLSTDRGLSYPYLLAENVDNDGSQQVIVPNAPSNLVKIKVKAANNIFFDISNLNSRITEPSDTTFYIGTSTLSLRSCLPNSSQVEINTAGFNSYADSITLQILSGLPDGASATFSPEKLAPGQSSMLDLNLENVVGDGNYSIRILGISAGDTIMRELVLETIGNDFSTLDALSPDLNEKGVIGIPVFSWVDVADADSYTLQLSSSPSFMDNLIDEKGITTTSFESNVLLSNSTSYYWRVIATNDCGKDYYTDIRAFSTEALQCNDFEATDLPKNISQSGLPVIESQILISGSGEVSDLNIKTFRGLHDNVKDLVVTLISPDGKQVVVLNKRCNNSSNFNCGFDDETPFSIQCPMTNGLSFLPEEPLAGFNGSPLQGLWTLRVEDTQIGKGGQFQEFVMEICSNEVLDNPVLINNNELGLPPGSTNRIKTQNLLTEDANNAAPELIYTIVSLPNNGILENVGTQLEVGSQFTQQDIDQDRINYRHDNSDATSDLFTFTVIDGEGGFIGITTFNIVIDPAFTSNTIDIEESDNIRIYPNPVNEQMVLNIEESIGIYDLTIIDVSGRVVYSENRITTTTKVLNTKSMADGSYFVIIQGEGNTYQKQIVIVH